MLIWVGMSRRDISGSVFGILFAAGVTTMAGAAAPGDYQKLLFWAGLMLAAVGTIGLGYLWVTSKKAGGLQMPGDQFNNYGNNFGHMGPVHIHGKGRLEMSEQQMASIAIELGTPQQ